MSKHTAFAYIPEQDVSDADENAIDRAMGWTLTGIAISMFLIVVGHAVLNLI